MSDNSETTTGNLKNFLPGVSGNPAGRPPGTKNRATIIKKFLALPMKTNPADAVVALDGIITVDEAVALSLIREALSGDVSAIRELQDTVHGKMVDKSEVGLTFTQMGKVAVSTAGKKTELSFDVGQAPAEME